MAPSSSFSGRNALIAFVAGVLAVLVFHQVMSSLLNAKIQWNMTPRIAPWGIPQIVNQAFWGGIWGLVFAWLAPRFPKGVLWWVTAALFGAILLPLVSWYVVPLIKGNPLGPRNGVTNSMLINGAWGLGMGVFWRLLNRI
jgi:phosphotransferase system  glucose/maltose/N-acetylglucosamine-specific IIC component